MNNLNEKDLCKLLKKVNTCTSIKDISEEILSGLYVKEETKFCAICILNVETNKIDILKYKAYDYKAFNDSEFKKFCDVAVDLLTSNFEQEESLDYMNSINKNQLITEPLIFCNNILGFVALQGFNKNFNKKYINAVQIICECLSSKLEIICMNEENVKKEKYRVEFLAGISHEFKTPLNSIIGFSDMLKLDCKDKTKFRYIDNISKSSRFLLSLIQDVLDLSRAQSKPLELSCHKFRPKFVVEDILLGFEEIKKDKNIEISFTLTDVEIYADLRRFKQLVYNLVSNAIKFNRQNGKVIIVNYLDENGKYVFEVKDTGDGISKKDCKKIFTFFTQVNSNQLKREQGSGVGLALCKKIVEAHGGNINFKSRLNSGSSFWFTLPVSQ